MAYFTAFDISPRITHPIINPVAWEKTAVMMIGQSGFTSPP